MSKHKVKEVGCKRVGEAAEIESSGSSGIDRFRGKMSAFDLMTSLTEYGVDGSWRKEQLEKENPDLAEKLGLFVKYFKRVDVIDFLKLLFYDDETKEDLSQRELTWRSGEKLIVNRQGDVIKISKVRS